MLKGFSHTQTTQGKSSLLSQPPWHFVGDAIAIFYQAELKHIKQFIPANMEVYDNQCAVFFLEWQRVTDNGLEYLNPVNSLYNETIVMLKVKYKNEVVSYAPFVWMDLDVSFFSGILQGWQNRIGLTRMTRAFSIKSKATPIVGNGGRFGASLMAKDRRLIDGEIKLEKIVDHLPQPNFNKVINHRYLPNPAMNKQSEPLLNDYVQVKSRDSKISEIWTGGASLQFYDTPDHELNLLKPVTTLEGYRFSFSTTVDDVVNA